MNAPPSPPTTTAAAGGATRPCIPWIEKYRPTDLKSIVLDPYNKTFFNNIIKKQYFPNLLFYGPPGTGKTTTIMSLISNYYAATGIQNRALVLHLNASDDRGIDVIRNQINQFVNSKTLFEEGMKFVILDEVDYMTKNAQQALRYLLQASCEIPVRFCLICNYISKIELSLKNEFICIRFNQLPREEIYQFLDDISQKEKLNLSPKIIRAIQKHYQSDIRSMVNFLQTNQSTPLCSADSSIHSATAPRIVQSTPLCSAQYVAGGDVIAPEIINEHAITKITTIARTCDVTAFRRFFYDLTIQYNMDKNEIIKEYFQHLIRGGSVRNLGMLEFIETIVHFCGGDFHEFIDYFYWGIREEFPAPSFTPII